jgi:hypothetical protein
MDAAIGDLVSPGQSLSVDIGQGEEGPSRKKIPFNVLHISFDATFLMGRFDVTGGGVEEVVAGEIEETGMKLDGGTKPVQDNTG